MSGRNWQVGPDWPVQAGKWHRENGRWVDGPATFTDGNYVSLADAHDLLIRLIMPEHFGVDTLQIDRNLRMELVSALGLFPRELVSNLYPPGKYPDHYYKYLLQPSSMDTRSDRLRIYNKVGIASGFICDVSCFQDVQQGLTYFLSVSMHANSRGDVESGRYDYFNIGIPFMRRLGAILYHQLSQHNAGAAFRQSSE
jgi:hypothetical protein